MIDALSSSVPPGVINTKGEGPLTLREERVVKLVAEGIGNREIGQSLGIEENSVKKAHQRVYDKLGVSIESKSLCMSSLFEGRGEQSPFPEPARALVALPIALSCANSGRVEVVRGSGAHSEDRLSWD